MATQKGGEDLAGKLATLLASLEVKFSHELHETKMIHLGDFSPDLEGLNVDIRCMLHPAEEAQVDEELAKLMDKAQKKGTPFSYVYSKIVLLAETAITFQVGERKRSRKDWDLLFTAYPKLVDKLGEDLLRLTVQFSENLEQAKKDLAKQTESGTQLAWWSPDVPTDTSSTSPGSEDPTLKLSGTGS